MLNIRNKIFEHSYLSESGPFLPSFLLNSDDESSHLDNSSLDVNESGMLSTSFKIFKARY